MTILRICDYIAIRRAPSPGRAAANSPGPGRRPQSWVEDHKQHSFSPSGVGASWRQPRMEKKPGSESRRTQGGDRKEVLPWAICGCLVRGFVQFGKTALCIPCGC
jgi:hypothetical protein